MIEFGASLKAAREAKGLSTKQLAEDTRVLEAIITGLENENFSKIVAPIYGRGFVKLYCEAVGLDPKPFVAEFMEIYSGNRNMVIKERAPVPPVAETPPPAADSPLQSPSVAVPPPVAVPSVAVPPPVATESAPPMPPSEPPMTTPDIPHPFARYSAPIRQRFTDAYSPAFLRWAALGLVAIVLIAGLVFGIRTLYRLTTEQTPTPNAPSATVRTDEPKSDASKAPRTPQKIPPLYMD